MLLKLVLFPLLYIIMECKAFYASSSVIVNLDSNNFGELVKKGKEIWVVEFFTPWCGHCEAFANEYEKAARAFEGIIKFGAINADENTDLVQEYDVSGYPTIQIFNGHKGAPQTYDGERKVRDLASFLEVSIHSKINSRLDGNLDPSMFKSKNIMELNERNFEDLVLLSKDMWLVVFYSPFCERCKDLSKRWKKVVSELHGMIKLGSMDATVNFATASNCKINGYPTIQFFPPGKKKLTSGINYKGVGKAKDIIRWALEEVGDHAPTPKVAQIVGFESLQNACDKKSICIVSFLPPIQECQVNCRNEHLNTLGKVSEKYRKSLWGWVWSEGGAQPEMEAALEVDASVYPAVVAVNVKKMMHTSLLGEYSFEAIDEFLGTLSFEYGDVKPITITKIPDIKKIDPWDGLNAELPLAGADALLTTRDEL